MSRISFFAAQIFKSHMVFQQNKVIRIWGTGIDNSEILVDFANKSVSCIVKNGEWMVEFGEMPASGPYDMKISCKEEQIIYDDIMIGEVWFAGGQSNMEMELQNSDNAIEEMKRADFDNIRFYNVKKCGFYDEEALEDEKNFVWKVCKPDTCYDMSAVAYYYAKELYKKLNVTIGIIDCYKGGTSAACWVSEEYLNQDYYTKKCISDYKKLIGDKTEKEYKEEITLYNEKIEKWNKDVEALRKDNPQIGWVEINDKVDPYPWPEPAGSKSPYRPCGLYENMIKRVAPFAVKGFIYYQGEEDWSRASYYDKLLKLVIKQWRHDWDDENLPFIVAQLPMYIENHTEDDKSWTIIREKQRKVCDEIDNAQLVVLIDCGEFDNIHPTDKKTVGYRFSLQSLNHVYGLNINADAPRAYDCSIIYNKAVIRFLSDKLVVKGEKRIPLFEIAGKDKIFYPANAVLTGDDKVSVDNENVIFPKYVKYAYVNYGKVTLFGEEGLPVEPFLLEIK